MTFNAESDTLVLGHFARKVTSYQEVAAHYKATYFKVDNWNAVTKGLSQDEIWRINETFLTQQLRQGKRVLFSHDPLKARTGSFREVDFLRQLGYTFRQKTVDMGSVSMTNNIPSEEDFARASSNMKQRSRGLSDVRERILDRFQRSGELHEFFILDCSDSSFRAYVFYPQEKDIRQAESSGLEARIRDAVFNELENVGRGNRQSVEVEFELDSHENVERKFEGNYFNRLH